MYILYLKPFEDVNKRVSRIAANIPFVRLNLRPLSFIDVSRDDYIAATLGVYEMTRIELLRDVFVWAYERSSRRCQQIRRSLGEPDPFRMRYRIEIKEVVGDIIRRCLDPASAAEYTREWTRERLPHDHRVRFMAVIEAELVGLHEGNF